MKTLFLILLIISAIDLTAQTGSIQGFVKENSNPIPGVNIIVLDTQIGGITDKNGNYKITNIPIGNRIVRFSAIGFSTKTFELNIEANKTIELNVQLEMEAIEVDEIEVIDQKIQEQSDTRVSVINIQPRAARTLPGAVTDVLRTLQSLPGVLAPNDFSSQLVVRGSGPDQNLIVMDDVEIFNPYRLYGVISMFNPEAVSDVNLITGGFPAKYGDRLSAVLDVTNRQGTLKESLAGNLNASIVSANLVLEGKNPFNIPGSWLVNSRRTYYDLIIEPFVKNSGLVEDNVSFPNFYDVQAKLAFGPFDGHKFFLNGIYSRDGVQLVSPKDRETPDSVGVFDITKNDVASFAWHFTPNNNILNKVIFSWYRNGGDTDFSSRFLDPSLSRNDFEDADTDTLSSYLLRFGFNSNYTFSKYSLDNKFTAFWGEDNIFEAGIGVDELTTIFDFDFQLDENLQSFFEANPNIRASINDLFDSKTYKRYRAYIDNNFKIGDKLFFKPGLRYDYYEILNKGYAAPRLSLSYALDEITTLRASWGIFYQSPGYEKLRDQNLFLDFSPQYTENLDAERSTHYVLSFERWLNNEWLARTEAYYKKFDNLIVQNILTGTNYSTEPIPGKDPRFVDAWTRPVPVRGDSTTQIPINGSFGEAYGLEFLLEKRNTSRDDKINGWVSYALSWADRYEKDLKLPFRFDQRHTFNFVMNYKINSWLEVGARFQYGSGFPITEAVGIKPRIILEDNNADFIPESPVVATRTRAEGETSEVIYDVDFGGTNNRFQSRKPEYHRLDIRFSAAADYWGFDWVFYLDVINVYNRANVIGYDYGVSRDLRLERERNTMFPILPTLGFNVKF